MRPRRPWNLPVTVLFGICVYFLNILAKYRSLFHLQACQRAVHGDTDQTDHEIEQINIFLPCNVVPLNQECQFILLTFDLPPSFITLYSEYMIFLYNLCPLIKHYFSYKPDGELYFVTWINRICPHLIFYTWIQSDSPLGHEIGGQIKILSSHIGLCAKAHAAFLDAYFQSFTLKSTGVNNSLIQVVFLPHL